MSRALVLGAGKSGVAAANFLASREDFAEHQRRLLVERQMVEGRADLLRQLFLAERPVGRPAVVNST